MDYDIMRGTTPTVTVESDEIDFTQFTCYLAGGRSLDQVRLNAADFIADDTQMTKTAHVLGCTLTQEQTLAMRAGHGVLQLRAVGSDGTAVATYAVPIMVGDVTQKGMI